MAGDAPLTGTFGDEDTSGGIGRGPRRGYGTGHKRPPPRRAPRTGDSSAIPGNRKEDYPDPDTLPGEPPGTGSAPRRRNPKSPLNRRPTPRRRTSSRPRRPSLTHPTGGRSANQVGHDAAGVILGMVVYALLLSVVQYGPKGPALWFKAKFLNQAAPAPGSSSSSTTPSTTGPLRTIRPGPSGKAS